MNTAEALFRFIHYPRRKQVVCGWYGGHGGPDGKFGGLELPAER